MPSTSKKRRDEIASVMRHVYGARAVAEDRRTGPRSHMGVRMKLTGMGCAEAHWCTAEDIGEGGVFVRMPSGAGLAVGQRCELLFPAESESPGLASVAGETCYATVVRTELVVEGTKKVVGAGLRFDRPVYL